MVTSDADPLSPEFDEPLELDRYSLSTAIYAERSDGKVLVLKRAEGTAMAGQFFPPGGAVDPGEDPWTAIERELREETGLRLAGPLSMVGCYPMFVYGQAMLQLTFRAAVEGDVILSHEHTDALWLTPDEMAAFLTPERRAELAQGNGDVAALLDSIAEDVNRYRTLLT